MDGCLSHVEPLSSLLAGCLGMVPASDWPFSAAPQRAPSLPRSLVPSCALVFSLCLTPNWFLPLPWKLVLASSGEEETQVGMEAEEEEDVRASERARAPFGFGCTPSRPPARAKCDGQTEGAKNGIFAWPLAPSHFRPIPANGLTPLSAFLPLWACRITLLVLRAGCLASTRAREQEAATLAPLAYLPLRSLGALLLSHFHSNSRTRRPQG